MRFARCWVTPPREAPRILAFRALTVFSVSSVLKNFAHIAKVVDAAALARQPAATPGANRGQAFSTQEGAENSRVEEGRGAA